jgi:hypothetical protein
MVAYVIPPVETVGQCLCAAFVANWYDLSRTAHPDRRVHLLDRFAGIRQTRLTLESRTRVSRCREVTGLR